jgi:hypothetical protein
MTAVRPSHHTPNNHDQEHDHDGSSQLTRPKYRSPENRKITEDLRRNSAFTADRGIVRRLATRQARYIPSAALETGRRRAAA